MSDVSTSLPDYQVSVDAEAFDEALKGHGIVADHYKAFPCPDGRVEIGDNRAPHPDHSGCEGGFIFRKAGTVTFLFIGNSKEKKQDDMGFWDGSSAQVSIPRFYDDQPEKGVVMAPFDRLYIRKMLPVETWQFFQCSDSQRDRLKYRISDVIYLRDSRGREYSPGSDFKVANGCIEWLGSSKPLPDTDMGPGFNGIGTEKAVVCGVRYTYQPFYYVGRVLHEIRVARTGEDENGAIVERMPQSVLIHREFLIRSNPESEDGAPGVDADAARTTPTPRNSR